MKRNSIKLILIGGLFTAGSLLSCNKKLDLIPTNDLTSAQVYNSPDGYKKAFAKVYAAFALTGNSGPSGNGDVQGIDEGTSDFFRLMWCAQELPTDEAVVGWGDPGLPDFHNMTWSSSNLFLKGIYYRAVYQITLANDFIRQSSDANLSSRGISGADADKIRVYAAEARFLRAYQYSILMDLFANPPFVTEKDPLGSTLPKQIARKDLFNYIESELKAIDGQLVKPKQNEYGRADQAAEWALLARIYLNAEVYTGTARYGDAITYSKMVIDKGGYKLIGDYTKLMRADNNLNTDEFILTINYDGLRTQSYGGATFMTHAPVGGSMPAAQFGISGGWAGLRTTKALVNLFPGGASSADKRAQFYTAGQNLEITDISTFTDGYAISKFKNVKIADGSQGSSLDYADMDLPIFRLAEQYLIYAEATTRGGTGGDLSTAIGYINKLRERAYGNANGDVTSITTDQILDERGRELYWEGFRRTDLIRYKKFVEDSYLWPFKGGVKAGKGVESYRTIYPLPTSDVAANPNLKQNTGY
ncbi:putative outer membrane starch-binding protein [Mucilaginibacter oryzae]|uniref:Putative outer membrane starch-binding protein n=1 Tax=Mucilaginibacter oryzae TaxID=468058 RepID=A0A316HAC9_9SPHI|nr:RagB/SusD family nutrient uptake outer membrane protein [Mucilaginibacter oryzae]PWK78044.1 putative outer membrane starch-binding protein [Mucilaginibacter oryzae]